MPLPRGSVLAAVLVSTVLATLPLGAPTAAQQEAPPSAAVLRAWALDGMERVSRTAAPVEGAAITLSAARGEVEPFQVAVHAQGGRLTGGDLEVTALDGPGDAVIPASAVTRYREHFVRVRRHSPDYYEGEEPLRGRWFPDALLPFVDPTTAEPPRSAPHRAYPYTVPADRTQPFWVDIRVPRDAPPGTYDGGWTVRTDQGEVSGTVTLQVRDFALPLTPAGESQFGIWRRGGAAAKERLLLDFGVQPDRYDVAREPDLVRGGLGVAPLGFWSGADIKTCTMRPPPSQRAVDRAAASHDPRLHLVNYTADEITHCPGLTERLRAYARRLHRAGADQLVTMVPRDNLFDDGTGRPAVDIWALLPTQAQRLPSRLRDRVWRTGGQLWSYQALVQGAHTPSWQIDFPPANFRILPGFLNAAMGYTGVLNWAVDYWQPDPWRDVVYTDSGCCFPGEGSLLYPGEPAGVAGAIPSLRLAWIREGIEDYGYVDLLRQSGCDPTGLLAPAASTWRRWTQDPRVIEQVRARLATAIEEAGNTGCPEPPPQAQSPLASRS